MKNSLLLFLILLIPLTSCFQRNEIFEHNKRILDENYEVNANYAVVTGRTYQTKDRTIDFGNLIDKQIRRDGKGVEVIYNTRFTSTLVEDNIYFFYEYKRVEDIGKFAVGYVDLVTSKVYADYFEYERSGLSWEYLYSTDEFVAYRFYEYDGIKDIKIVFFKDSNKLEFDYNLNNLEYGASELEEVQEKDYYIQDGIKYTLDWNKLINSSTGEVITLPNGNELRDSVPIIKEIYDKFTYDNISINLTYLSNGDELFFYIQDRPTNSLNAPFMLFKCNLDLSEVSYIGYYDHLIFNVVLEI